MSVLTETRVLVIPRVNLLPPEIEERQRFRRTQVGLGAAVLGAVVVVGAVYAVAAADASDAQDQLAASQAEQTTLQAEAGEYAEVPQVYAAVETKAAQVQLALGQEVRWSLFLNDLSLTVPERVWVDSLIVNQDVDAASAAPVTAPGSTPFADVGIGTVTFTGKAYAHNDVAAWLESLAGQKGYAQPYVTSSVLGEIGTKDAVSFSSEVAVTADARSNRYAEEPTP